MDDSEKRTFTAHLEDALSKQVATLRDLLSNLVEEEQSYRENKGIEGLLVKRLTLLEAFEDAEAKGVPLIERYLLEKGQPSLIKTGLKIQQLNAFKSALSIDELSLSIQVDQLISLLDKIQETSHNLSLLDQQGPYKPLIPVFKEKPKKSRTKVVVIE